MVGAIDVATDHIETPEEVAETLRHALKYVDADKLYPCTNCGMAPLSRSLAMHKLRLYTRVPRLFVKNFPLEPWRDKNSFGAIIDFITTHFFTISSLAVTGICRLTRGFAGRRWRHRHCAGTLLLFQASGVAPDSAMLVATATSLATIVPTSISSICAHHKKGHVDFPYSSDGRSASFSVLCLAVGL